MSQALCALVIACLLLGILAACGEASPPLDPTDTVDTGLGAVTVPPPPTSPSRQPPTPTQSDTPTPTQERQGSGKGAIDPVQVQLGDLGATSEKDSSQDEDQSDGPTRPRTTLRDQLDTMAEQEVSKEEALWRLRWREGLEQVVEKLQQDYSDDYSRAGDVQGRYVVVGFRTRVPSGAQGLLDEFSDLHHVAVRVEIDDGYSAPDLERAIRRVHYALYCDQYVEDTFTDSDEGVIRSRILPSVDSPLSIADFEGLAQEVLRYGPHEGLSVEVEEWPKDEASPDPAERERLCDEYRESQPYEEWDTRVYAIQEGVEYEELFYLSGWHDDLRVVVGSISQSYPQSDVRLMRYGKGRSAQVGFVADVPPGAEAMLQDFGLSYGIKIDIRDNLGFNERELSDAIPRVYRALYEAPGVATAWTGAGNREGGEIVVVVELKPGVPVSHYAELRALAVSALRSGPHSGMSVKVEEWAAEYQIEVIKPSDWAMLDYAITVCFAWDMMVSDVNWSRRSAVAALQKATPPTRALDFHEALLSDLSQLSRDYSVAMAKEAFAPLDDYSELKEMLPCPLEDEPFVDVVQFADGGCSRTLSRSEYMWALFDKVPTLREPEDDSYRVLNASTDGDSFRPKSFVCPGTPYRDGRPVPERTPEPTS